MLEEPLKKQRAASRTSPYSQPDSGLITDPETGEIINIETSQVIQENSSLHDGERRSFDDGGKNEQAETEMPVSPARHDTDLSTIMGRANRDASGNVLNVDMRARIEGSGYGRTGVKAVHPQSETDSRLLACSQG